MGRDIRFNENALRSLGTSGDVVRVDDVLDDSNDLRLSLRRNNSNFLLIRRPQVNTNELRETENKMGNEIK